MAPGIVKRSSDSCFYGNSVKRMIRKMIRNVKHFFMWIFLIPQATGGGSITWHEPTPPFTTSSTAEAPPLPGIVQGFEGSPVALNWSYTLTSNLSLGVLSFKTDGIAQINSNGSAGPVAPKFWKRFQLSSNPGRVSLSVSPLTVADDKTNGTFVLTLIDDNLNTWKREIQVQVKVPTNIIGISGKTTVLHGENLQLTCEASGQPEPNITWTKEKPGKQRNTGVIQGRQVLTITNINRTDAGIFTCTAYNGFGKPEKQTVYVNVTYPPKIVNFETEYITGLQQTLTLNCEAEGNPPPTYTWTPYNDPEQVYNKNTLDISQVLNDANYTCRVANLHGNDAKTASVYIGGNVINITIDITSETCEDGKYKQSLILEKFKDQVKEAFAGKPGYEGVQSISARCGGIIVDLALKFNSTTKEQDVITTLYDAVIHGRLGELSVGAIKGKRPNVKTTSRGPTVIVTVGPPEGIAWWTIVLAVVIVLLLVASFWKSTGRYPALFVTDGKHQREVQPSESTTTHVPNIKRDGNQNKVASLFKKKAKVRFAIKKL